MTPNGVVENCPDRRLRPEERLRKTGEYQRVYREGKSFPGTHLVLFVLAHPDLERRAGFVAGRRVGNAVARNRSKRLLREGYRHLKHELPETGYHVVLVARKGCSQASFQNIETELVRLFIRAGIAEGAGQVTSLNRNRCT